MKTLAAWFVVSQTLCLAAAAAAQQPSLDDKINQDLPSLVATYQKLHAAPELSHYEKETSAFVAAQLRALGYDVTERVGQYPPASAGEQHPAWTAYGVVAMMKNGAGPTVLVRTELDALPVEEKTGLAYASTAKTKNDAGETVSVMHACGHDIHMTSLLGTAKMLTGLKSQWHGTLIFIGQPAEESINGAESMLAGGLYTRFPKPDACLALHDSPDLEAGKVGYTPGYALASSTAVDVFIRGHGGHGSRPESTKDPVVAAAEYILALQTIVSRENSPFDPAVVTVGSIHGGTRHNIIPDEVHLQLTLRTYKEEVRQRILASLDRMARGIALADGIPEDRAPIVRSLTEEFTPATYNDPQLTERVAAALRRVLGPDNVVQMPPIMASEDFGRLGLEGRQIPICQFTLGAVDAEKLAESRRTGKSLPSLHSSLFAPVPEPTIRTGVKAMTSAVLELMK